MGFWGSGGDHITRRAPHLLGGHGRWGFVAIAPWDMAHLVDMGTWLTQITYPEKVHGGMGTWRHGAMGRCGHGSLRRDPRL